MMNKQEDSPLNAKENDALGMPEPTITAPRPSTMLPNLEYLIDGAKLQESLLQSYRQIYLVVQSLFLVGGISLFISILSFDTKFQIALAESILLVLFFLSIHFLVKMKEIVTNRGKDVTFWRRKLMLAEQEFPFNKRYFTDFRISQSLDRKGLYRLKDLISLNKLDMTGIDSILAEGEKHTRNVLDKHLFDFLIFFWIVMVGFSLAYVLSRYF